MNNELITLVANIALTLSFIVAVIFGIAQVRTAKLDRKERLTLETLRSFHSREFAELLFYVTAANVPKTITEWNLLSANERVQFIQFSQMMESLGLLLAERLINVDLVDKTLGSFVFSTWEKYKPLFTDMREKNSDPFLGEYFQWMAEQIDLRMKQNPRKPFFEMQRMAV